VVPKEESSRGGEWFEMSESGNNFILEVDISKSGMDAEIYVNDKNVLSTRVGKNGKIIIAKKSTAGRRLIDAVMSKSDIKVTVHD
jgi:ATPase